MPATPVDFAYTNHSRIARGDVLVKKLTLIEFDGTNASDIASYLSGNSIGGASYRVDSGDFFITVSANIRYDGSPATDYGLPVEYQLESGDRLMIDAGNALIGVFDEAKSGEVSELA